MGKNQNSNNTTSDLKTWTDEFNELHVFRIQTIAAALLMIMLLVFMIFEYDFINGLCRAILGNVRYQQIAGQDFSALYDTQINLLFTAISVLAIIVSFFDQRYLGANYKYWLFKKTPYLLTPQEIIMLMACMQLGGFLHIVTGRYRIILFLCFLVSWCLFLYLCYLVYVHVVKVSCMLQKVGKQLKRSYESGKWNERCKDIYKKVTRNPLTGKKDSYWDDEIALILLAMGVYHTVEHKDLQSEEMKNLKKAILDIARNEAHVRSGHVDPSDGTVTTMDSPEESVYLEVVKKIIAIRDDLFEEKPENKNQYKPSHKCTNEETAEANLKTAFGKWYGTQAS